MAFALAEKPTCANSELRGPYNLHRFGRVPVLTGLATDLLPNILLGLLQFRGHLLQQRLFQTRHSLPHAICFAMLLTRVFCMPRTLRMPVLLIPAFSA